MSEVQAGVHLSAAEGGDGACFLGRGLAVGHGPILQQDLDIHRPCLHTGMSRDFGHLLVSPTAGVWQPSVQEHLGAGSGRAQDEGCHPDRVSASCGLLMDTQAWGVGLVNPPYGYTGH